MLEKNEIVCGTVEAVGSNGEGIIKLDTVTFFVPACLPGEKVTFKILKIKNNVGYGKLEEVLTPAEERTRAKCPVFLRCGGCALQHMAYGSQLLHKNGVVKDALRKIGGLQVPILPTVASDMPFGYRNKLQMPIGVDKSGETVIGFYAERSHRIVPVSSCAIHPKWAELLIAVLYRYAKECAVKGYDEEQKTGALRHIVAREIGGKFLFTLVTANRLPPCRKYLSYLSSRFSL